MNELAAAAEAVGVGMDDFAVGAADDARRRKSPAANACLAETSSVCWGYVLTEDSSGCTPGFVIGSGHFKNKFCPGCLTRGFDIDPARARLLPNNSDPLYVLNPSSHGLWASNKA